MATQIWRGDAPAVAQIDSVTPANVGVGNVFKVTCNGKTVQFVATATTVANVTAGLAAALNATGVNAPPPEFQEITWSDQTTFLQGVAKVAGRPFTITASATGGTATNTRASVTANSSPSDINNGANWSTGSVPTNGDDVIIDGGAPLLYNLSSLSAVTLASMTIKATAPQIGLPDINTWNSQGNYREYRATRFAIAATKEVVGLGTGGGSSLVRRDFGSVQTAITVLNTGTAPTGQYAYDWIGTHASNTMAVLKGSVAVSPSPGVASNLATLQIGYVTNKQNDASVFIGDGVTLGSITQGGGVLVTNCNMTTLVMTDGKSYVQTGEVGSTKAGTVGTLTIQGGTCYYRSTGTCTTLAVYGKATVDFSTDVRSRTVTNSTLYSNSTFFDPARTVTLTNATLFDGCGFEDVSVTRGKGITVSL